jgi:hypothetical protein
MADVVQIQCPHCQNTLRVPVGWTDQPMRCKHCKQVFQGRKVYPGPAAVAAGPPPAPKAPPAKAPPPAPPPKAPVPRAAAPTKPAPPRGPAGANPFAFDAGSPHVVAPKPREGLGPVKAALLGCGILSVVGLAAVAAVVLLGSHLLHTVFHDDGPTATATKTSDRKDTRTTTAKDTTLKGKDTTATATTGKDTGPASTGPATTGKDTPKDTAKDTPKDTAKDDPAFKRTDDIYPRRALLISISQYQLMDPVAYGKPPQGPFKGSTTAALSNRLFIELDFPRKQVVEMSDRAAPPTPPVKSAVENTIVDFLANARAQDCVLLLFAGHAVEIGMEAYLVPVEANPRDPKALISFTWLYKELAGCKARQKVLVLDVCRQTPAGAGASMGEVLAAKLQQPPPGVQVWAACAAKGRSPETEANGSLFLEALVKRCDNLPTAPEYAIPVTRWEAAVRAELDELAKASKLAAPAMLLAGAEPGKGPFDAKLPQPAQVVVKGPTVEQPKPQVDPNLKHILDEIALVPPAHGGKALPIPPDTLPQFAPKMLAAYKADYPSILVYKDKEAEAPLRFSIAKAILAMQASNNQIRPRQNLPKDWSNPTFKKMIKAEQNAIAAPIFELKDSLKELLTAGEKHRDGETKRVQALYDYLVLRLKQRVIYTVEYNYLLARIATDEVPALEDGDTQIRLLPQQKVQVGEVYIKDYVKELSKEWPAFAKTYMGTPWAEVSAQDQQVQLGLAWKSAK